MLTHQIKQNKRQLAFPGCWSGWLCIHMYIKCFTSHSDTRIFILVCNKTLQMKHGRRINLIPNKFTMAINMLDIYHNNPFLYNNNIALSLYGYINYQLHRTKTCTWFTYTYSTCIFIHMYNISTKFYCFNIYSN